ncbi:bifunctional diaminohydroxyphosphoribosylaminopyrimidine deaminase/5-amino-6-(5-phosphoribosylamino)uracil reductase RibD [Nonomuraea sp. NPDC059007]|uniref:bifunctional diaminohydroxyphosphoribosylaminopyrimidine deaminase/5-amino-6-(5-phosphoribosylamino)uracil reductase RibD n=1 Tax=Nonomuraea sp. NPDC059007 TaxID=3346692 RepID=UPI003691259D
MDEPFRDDPPSDERRPAAERHAAGEQRTADERHASGQRHGAGTWDAAGEWDAGHMARAVELAAFGLGTTSPNPVVGCVILDAHGEVAGEGFHAYAGGPHAEVVALRSAGERARGGTAYVTLEPCDHTGSTGPCTEALLAAGLARVVYAVPDPNPLAAGGGERLRAHGVEVAHGLLGEEAERVNAAWLTSVRLGRPHVTWKFAATLDGRSAAADGTSKWITSPQARQDVHRLRAASDAIIAGIGTVLADDPLLTARPAKAVPDDGLENGPDGGPASELGDGLDGRLGRGLDGVMREQLAEARRRARPPLRVVVDSGARTPAGARVLDGAAPTLVAIADTTRTGLTAELARLPYRPDGLDLHALLAELRRRGVLSVFLEGGPTLAGSFVRQGLVDRVVAYVAPALLGSGRAALGQAGVSTIAGIHSFVFEEVSMIGPDLRLTARPGSPKEK